MRQPTIEDMKKDLQEVIEQAEFFRKETRKNNWIYSGLLQLSNNISAAISQAEQQLRKPDSEDHKSEIEENEAEKNEKTAGN